MKRGIIRALTLENGDIFMKKKKMEGGGGEVGRNIRKELQERRL